jgi:catalase-peroxidase
MDGNDSPTAGKCPVMHATFSARSNRDWWPNQLNLKILHQNTALSNPMGEGSTTPRRSARSTTQRSRRT